MTTIRNVSGTAFVVAEFRNDENSEPHPLYHDPFVGLFLDAESKQAADRISASFPPIRKNVRLRTRYLDDRLDQQLQQGCRQVVILGAGLDTRPQRKEASNVAYYEIDDPDTLAFKKATLLENCIDPGVNYIPGNYVTDGLVELLKDNGFDFGLPTHVIWEGNTMYLTAAAVSKVLQDLMRHIQRCSVSFDYMAEEMIKKTTGDAQITSVVEKFAAMGAPWIYGIDNIKALAGEHGATILDNFEIAHLHRAYWPAQQLDSPIYNYYSICTLRTDRN